MPVIIRKKDAFAKKRRMSMSERITVAQKIKGRKITPPGGIYNLLGDLQVKVCPH